MRRLTLLATLAVVFSLVSCSNDQEIGNKQPENSETEINFRSLIDKGAKSRATATDGSNILGFTVTGWWDKTSNGTGNITTPKVNGGYLFNAFDISRRENGMTAWDYDPKLYWPSNGSGVTFFAYSPASSKNVGRKTSDNPEVYVGGLYNYAGAPVVYTVPDPGEKESQEDFLVARTNKQKSGSVTLNFAHALSRATFSAMKAPSGLTYLVKSVELVNIKKTGMLDLAKVPTDGSFTDLYGDTDPVVLWETTSLAQPTDKNIKVDLGNSPVYVRDDAYTSLLGPTNALMILPQTTTYADTAEAASSGFMVKVLYKAFLDAEDEASYYAGTKGNDDDTYKVKYFAVKDAVRSAAANSDVAHSFEIGRQYNFTLTFGAEAKDPILFLVDVGDWKDAPQQDLPQPNYWFDRVIGEALAYLANKNYKTEGVTLEQILVVSAGTTGVVMSNDDLKGLDLFENLKNLTIETGVDGLDIVIPVEVQLNTLTLAATYVVSDKKAVVNTIDLSTQTSLTEVKYYTYTNYDYSTNPTGGYATLNIGKLSLATGSEYNKLKGFLYTGHQGSGTPSRPPFSIADLWIGGAHYDLPPGDNYPITGDGKRVNP